MVDCEYARTVRCTLHMSFKSQISIFVFTLRRHVRAREIQIVMSKLMTNRNVSTCTMGCGSVT